MVKMRRQLYHRRLRRRALYAKNPSEYPRGRSRSGSSVITNAGFRDAAEASLVPMTEADLASYRRRQAKRIVCHRGRYWSETSRGFFEPVHAMARLTTAEVTRPQPLCWGYRAALTTDTVTASNATMPTHLLSDLDGFGTSTLSANRRSHLRRCQRSVRVVQIPDPRILRSQGYQVFLSAQTRTRNPYRDLWPVEEYMERMEWFMRNASVIILAGLIDGQLGGYIAGHAVDGSAYIDAVDLATEVLSTHISTCLHVEFVELCRRSYGIREVVHSPHIPEDAALGVFKVGIGFPVVHVPIRLRVLPLIDAVIRWHKPFFHYRLTGRENATVLAARPSSAGLAAS